MLSACSYCQGRNYLSWTGYDANCSTVYVTVYNEEIPIGVKVPAYAYQDVSVSDSFNVTLAQDTTGTESSRPPASITSSFGLTKSSAGLSGGNNGSGSKTNNVGAIVGGVVGGVVFLGIIGSLIAFFVLRSRPKPKPQIYDTSSQQSPDMAFTPNPTVSLLPSTMSPPSGSPARIYNPNDPTTYPHSVNPSAQGFMQADPHMQQPPFNPNMTPNYTGNSAQNYHSMPVPQHTGVSSHYTGAPEI